MRSLLPIDSASPVADWPVPGNKHLHVGAGLASCRTSTHPPSQSRPSCQGDV
ncbi:hypothetical protein BO85DRAFT_452334 [Aspergillus piperis CBS 112811]|uniref:Uncharacterized protein n=1 Tax=Aspergillus piperis CBS 112811 TaxID=1448313 RepID=A0A8G1QU57_9EURO|nr:hypothetical protein BO85DRAFT_452334 [Aspergillus piperis CBS 112811]RAH54386.1 hypothetical protein BO85DRAFT_452334 [Aspergillus piperis CBS 112811]